jgi:hypothetical protein
LGEAEARDVRSIEARPRRLARCALVNPDPRPLAAIMRSSTPELPLLAKALHRQLMY